MNIKPSIVVAGLLLAGLSGGPARADHNSPFGEGFANMPNDIHNTRVDSREEDDNEAFVDFVRFGEGAKTINRFLTSKTPSAERSAVPDVGGNQR